MLGFSPIHGALSSAYQVTAGQMLAASLLAGFLLFIRTVSYTTTIAHEGGHALFASLFGVPVAGIKFTSPDVASTGFKTELRGLTDVLITMAGHLGPSLFGLLAASLLYAGRPDAVLWAGLVLLTLFLFLARNLRAILAPLAIGAIVIAALNSGDVGTQALVALTWAWILLIGAVLDVFGLRTYRRVLRSQGQRDTKSDVYMLRKATWIPAGLWVLVLLLLTLAALFYGASLLLDMPRAPTL